MTRLCYLAFAVSALSLFEPTFIRAATIGSPVIMPSVIPSGRSTVVTLTLPIHSDGVPPRHVVLLRLGDGGDSQEVSALHDDGLSGDAVAHDGLYTTQLTLDEFTQHRLLFQASVTFGSDNQIHLSRPISINVRGTGAAPILASPSLNSVGALAGVDSDADGLRDDVQRQIDLQYGASSDVGMALTQLAKAYGTLLQDSSNPSLGPANTNRVMHAIDCLLYLAPSDGPALLKQIKASMLDTSDRLSAYLGTVDSLGSYFYYLPKQSERSGRCVFSSMGQSH